MPERRIPNWFVNLALAVMIAGHLTGYPVLRGLGLVLFLYELLWGYDNWRANRTHRRAEKLVRMAVRNRESRSSVRDTRNEGAGT